MLEDTKAFIQYSSDIYDNYKNLREYQPSKKRKTLLLFDDVITTMLSSNEFNTLEVFIRGRKLNIFRFYHTVLAVPKILG